MNVAIKPYPQDDSQASNAPQQEEQAKPSALDDYGLTVMPSDDGKGVVVTDVDRQGDAADKGITTGDIIVSVNNKPVNDRCGY